MKTYYYLLAFYAYCARTIGKRTFKNYAMSALLSDCYVGLFRKMSTNGTESFLIVSGEELNPLLCCIRVYCFLHPNQIIFWVATFADPYKFLYLFYKTFSSSKSSLANILPRLAP